MATKGKSRKAKKNNKIDLEAIGLLLLACGFFILGFLLPFLPTGDLGATLRTAVMSRIGLAAYALPLPAIVLGGIFLLKRNPKRWPRHLLGYLILMTGLWALLMLFNPAVSGNWGVTLRNNLTGAAGGLSYLIAIIIATLGLDLLLGWQPTHIIRSISKASVNAIRTTFKAFWAARTRAKERAAFHADVSLAKEALVSLDKDLKALNTLYPGSAEIENWRKAIRSSLTGLKKPDADTLADTQTDIHAWQTAVTDFSQNRARELESHFKAEGIAGYDTYVRSLKTQLDDPLSETHKLGRALDDLRKTLALDFTALAERYRRLTRERDLAETALVDMKPRDLLRAYESHQKRLGQYVKLEADIVALEELTEQLEPWRDLSNALLRIQSEFAGHDDLKDYENTLVKELRDKGRPVLAQHEGWHKALESVEASMREQSMVFPDADLLSDDADALEHAVQLDDWQDTDESTIDADINNPLEALEDTSNTNETQDTEDELPEVGGIPIQLPSYTLLDELQEQREDPARLAQEVQARVSKIDETLSNFKLEGRVNASVRGPTVTRFEVEPAPGEKISRFANLSDDLALAMAVGSVRIEAPIPGKSVIGLEVPNANRDLIRFREAAEAPSFKRSKARLPMILGKSIDGELVVADLAKMPHLLIAGSTGSGKSVAVNTLIGSLLYKFLPTELRFLMIDPKMVELTPYDGIPHLLRPVVTNPNDAAGVLLGAVAHMERRYKMMSKIGAKNLDQYNEKARNLDLPEMPFITIIIDELADLMITSPKEVESAIMRLAQMARATGMHLVLATQRPSVDILTSLIKVNVPARMAFAVSSGHDSRTILDTMGAERLIGMGDMLYYQPGLVKPMRLQGPFISEEEIHSLATFLRRQYFDDEFVEAYGSDFDPPSLHESDASGLIDWNDDKLRGAAELVVSEGQASVSRLQRRLSVGHARAGKLMDSLESLGVVGPHVGSKPRDVLVNMEELPNIFGK